MYHKYGRVVMSLHFSSYEHILTCAALMKAGINLRNLLQPVGTRCRLDALIQRLASKSPQKADPDLCLV